MNELDKLVDDIAKVTINLNELEESLPEVLWFPKVLCFYLLHKYFVIVGVG